MFVAMLLGNLVCMVVDLWLAYKYRGWWSVAFVCAALANAAGALCSWSLIMN